MEVQLFSLLRRLTKTGTVEVQAGTVKEALAALVERFGPALAAELFDASGEVKPLYNLLLNGRNIAYLSGLDTPLAEGDTLTIIPPAAGG
ncbi:MAG: MoaD family protein [Bacillota bacterium]|nr:MoaD family protein [Bacillota bacterium]